jgi:beta-lactam-binding protein with PASTA domain
MPAVVGMRLNDAESVLAGAGLRVRAILAVPGEKNVVVRTDPPVGSPMAPGSAVTLYVGGQKPGKGHHHGHGGGDRNGQGGGGD